MANADTQLLLHLLRRADHTCPPVALLKHSGSHLLQSASNNKVAFVLEHFLNCARCQSYLHPKFIQQLKQYRHFSISTSLLYESEKRWLNSFLRQKKIKNIFFKDSFKKLNRSLFATWDIDLLTNELGAKTLNNLLVIQGYKKKDFPPKEITYTKQHRLSIDVHTLIAYPPYGSLTEREIMIVQKFSQNLLQTSAGDERNDLQLISLCIRFFFNDLATGLGSLHEILLVTQKIRSTRAWKKFLQLTQKYGIKNEMMFCILLASRFFQQPLHNFIRRSVAWRVRLLAFMLPIKWVTDYLTPEQWHEKELSVIVHIKQERLHILKLILRENSSFFRLLRPRIMLFFLAAITENFRLRVNLLSFSSH